MRKKLVTNADMNLRRSAARFDLSTCSFRQFDSRIIAVRSPKTRRVGKNGIKFADWFLVSECVSFSWPHVDVCGADGVSILASAVLELSPVDWKRSQRSSATLALTHLRASERAPKT